MKSETKLFFWYCLKNYPRGFYILFGVCLIINLAIVTLGKTLEKIKFGHEIGVFFLPLASAFLGGIIFHFFTNHWGEMKQKIVSYKNLDSYFRGFRRAIKHVCWSLAVDKNQIDQFTFYEIDLNESIKIQPSLIGKDENIPLSLKSGTKGIYDGNLFNLKNQFFDELVIRYLFELITLDLSTKSSYQDLCIMFERYLKVEFDSRELAVKNFSRSLPTLIGLVSKANLRLSKDKDFLEVVSMFYKDPAKFGQKCPSTLVLKTTF